MAIFELDKSKAELMKLIREKSAQGIHLSVIGFGSKQEAIVIMQEMAEAGGGFYTHVHNEEEAKDALSAEVSAMSRKEAALIEK